MGSNLGYLLKSFFLYNTCIIKWSITCCFDWWNFKSISLEITCIYLKIPMHGAKTSPNYRLYWISSSHHTTFVLLQSWCCWIQIISCWWPRKNVEHKKMVFCYQNCSDLLWEEIVQVVEKNFWNSRLKAEDLQKFWDHSNNLFKQWKVRTIFGNRMLF